MSLRETCHCGHDKASHYRDCSATPPAMADCLGPACDCKRYVNEWEPKPTKAAYRPSHAGWCRCYDCLAYHGQQGTLPREHPGKGTDTLPVPGWPRWSP